MAPKPAAPRAPLPHKPRPLPKGDEVYLNQVLNNRFKVESKIGEGGFGAVYRGVQLATGRKVALKLLHPEMTKDENLVARFRREGMVLCNLRDAHTITTYDFDQTPDGTLYIAMELLEGKSLHQVFHEQAPLEWKRMFKILIEMCSSLAEAHAQGIVHRDLKPENVYLESRPGNPEFVKILDFGIAKVMRGDSIDPQSPQLTATGQTLGTLEYMSPEQLMGKALDGRSDVYALGVVAYEMITGRLPFPDAKGPAGLITAQLKQTPQPPSVANPKARLPPAADRVILKCLEKDKNNRHADVSAMAAALQDVIDQAREASSPMMASPVASGSRAMPQDMLETRRGELPVNTAPPALPPTPYPGGVVGAGMNVPSSGPVRAPMPNAPTQGGLAPPGVGLHVNRTTPGTGSPKVVIPSTPYPYPMQNSVGSAPIPNTPFQQPQLGAARPVPAASSSRWIWWIVGLLALGAVAGAVLALLMKHR
ncbi:MAG TPA: serine/threonine-protein kinase [Kofleriaceae bacterium]|nr:serine/threonine-protein kinase [Kofleriaceae bacterium]